MKLFLFVLILIFNLSLHAQEKDSTFCHYGFVMDYHDEMINQLGFKYRPTKSIAYFLRGNLTTQKPWKFSEGNENYQELRKYNGVLGIEYTLHRVDNLLLSVLASGGISIVDYNTPYYGANYFDYIGNYDQQQITYSLTTGLGEEYFFSKHISIGCSQMLSLYYSSGNSISDFGASEHFTHTKVVVGNTKFTLSFYF